MDKKNNTTAVAPPRGRLIIGGIVFISGFLCPLLIPWVLATDLSAGFKSVLTGLLALGIPELFMIIAAAILGKPGYQYLKQSLLKLLKRYGPPERVSKTRYTIGLVMFIIPLFVGWGLPYFAEKISIYTDHRLIINIVFDAMLIVSIFVLGGEFWDKLRSLFIWGATVHFPVRKQKE
jgi:hypothetical protein